MHQQPSADGIGYDDFTLTDQGVYPVVSMELTTRMDLAPLCCGKRCTVEEARRFHCPARLRLRQWIPQFGSGQPARLGYLQDEVRLKPAGVSS